MQTINLGGKDYPILFDFNVVEAVQERYGDLALLSEKMDRLKEVKWLLTALIAEGIAKHNYDTGESIAQFTELQVGMLLSMQDIKSGKITKSNPPFFVKLFKNILPFLNFRF